MNYISQQLFNMKTGLVEFQPEFWQGNLISLFASSICSPWINLHQNWCIKSSQPTLYWYDLNKFLVSLACDVLHLPFCQMDPNFLSAGTNRNFLRKCGREFIGRQTTICGKISSISSRCKIHPCWKTHFWPIIHFPLRQSWGESIFCSKLWATRLPTVCSILANPLHILKGLQNISTVFRTLSALQD